MGPRPGHLFCGNTRQSQQKGSNQCSAARCVGDETWLAGNIEGQTRGQFEISDLSTGDGPSDGKVRLVRSDWVPGQPVWRGLIDDNMVSVQVKPILNGVLLSWRGVQEKACVFTEREAQLARLMPIKLPPDTSKFLLCPMPGLVKSVMVEEGQAVQAGDALAIVEAMKMENVLRAERDATVSKVKAVEGDSLAVLFRSQKAAAQHAPASLRLLVSAYRQVHILKQRGGNQHIDVDLPPAEDRPQQPQLWELPAYTGSSQPEQQRFYN